LLNLKSRQPSTQDSGAPTTGVSSDSLSDLFDAINQMGDDLRRDSDAKFVTLKSFKDHCTYNDDDHADFKKRINDIAES
jgi:hypothetical protein